MRAGKAGMDEIKSMNDVVVPRGRLLRLCVNKGTSTAIRTALSTHVDLEKEK